MKCLFLILYLFFSCSNIPRHSQAARNFMDSFAKEVKAKEGLTVLASGGSMMGDIKQICFKFKTIKNLDISSARKLYVRTIRSMIDKINQNLSIRPFLHNYPADIGNVEISISFYQSNGLRVESDYVAYIFMVKNKIYYDSWCGDFKTLHEETYEEALKIVNGS